MKEDEEEKNKEEGKGEEEKKDRTRRKSWSRRGRRCRKRRKRNRGKIQKEVIVNDIEFKGINVDNQVLLFRTLCFCNKGAFNEALFELPSLYEESTWHIHTLVLNPGLFPFSDIRVRYHEVLLHRKTQAVLPQFLR